MSHKRRTVRIVFGAAGLLAAALLLAACDVLFPGGLPGGATDTPTATLTATPTLTPTSTPTPTPTPRPRPAQAITRENAAQIQQLARFGGGHINQLACAPGGEQIAAAAVMGLYTFDARTAEQTAFVESDVWYGGAAYNSSGDQIAIGSWNQILIVARQDLSVIKIIQGEFRFVRWIRFTADDRRLIFSGGEDRNQLIGWDIESNTQLWAYTFMDSYGYPGHVESIALSPDGKQIAVVNGYPPYVTVLDAATGQVLKEFKAIQNKKAILTGIVFTPDGGKIIVVGQYEILLAIFEADTGTLITTLERTSEDYARGSGIAISTDGKTVFVSDDLKIIAYDVETGAEVTTLTEALKDVQAYTLCASADTLALGGEKTVTLVNTATGQVIGEAGQFGNSITDSEFTDPAGQIIYYNLGLNINEIRLDNWDWADDQPPVTTLSRVSGLHARLEFAPNGKYVGVAASGSNEALIFESAPGTQLAALGGYSYAVEHVSFSSPGGETSAVVTTWQDPVQIWDTFNQRAAITIPTSTRSSDERPDRLRFSPDGALFVTSAGQVVRRYEAATGAGLGVSDGPAKYKSDRDKFVFTTCLEFDPTGARFAVCSNDGLLIYNAADGKVIGQLFNGEHVSAAGFSSTGLVAAAVGDHRIVIMDGEGFAELFTLPAPGRMNTIIFNPDSTIMGFGGEDGVYRVWGVP